MRLWPVVAVLGALLPAVVTAQLAAGLLWLLASRVLGLESGGSGESGAVGFDAAAVAQVLVATLFAQGAFVVVAILGTFFVERPAGDALGLARRRLGVGDAVLLAATLFPAAVSQLWWDWRYDEPSEALVQLSRLVVESPAAVFPFLLVAFSVLPGFCEELLFRGFVQRHLLLAWRPVHAIAVSSLVFAAVHLDPQHVWSVLPLAVWLGYLGWRTGSIWAGVLVHAFNNGFSILMMRLDPTTADATSAPWTIAMVALGLPAFLWTVWRLERTARSSAPPAP